MRHLFFYKINNFSKLALKISEQYDLIVPCGDFELKAIKDSNLSEASKLKLLPVIHVKFVNHLCSKIELAKLLKKKSDSFSDI